MSEVNVNQIVWNIGAVPRHALPYYISGLRIVPRYAHSPGDYAYCLAYNHSFAWYEDIIIKLPTREALFK